MGLILLAIAVAGGILLPRPLGLLTWSFFGFVGFVAMIMFALGAKDHVLALAMILAAVIAFGATVVANAGHITHPRDGISYMRNSAATLLG